MQIDWDGESSPLLTNLAEINPTRLDGKAIDSHRLDKLPAEIDTGRVQLRALPRDYPVAATRQLAANGHRGNLFGHAGWALLLVLLCGLAGALEFYFNAYNEFKISDLVKYLLRETVLTLGAFVMTLSILERLLVNRWEIRQLLVSVCLVYLLYYLVSLLAGGLDYLLSASWPGTWLYFGWYLIAIPVAIALYLMHISHLSYGRSCMLAIMIAAPIALPTILQSSQMRSMLASFSPSASYHNQLSYLNWHLQGSVDIERFIEQAQTLEAGRPAD